MKVSEPLFLTHTSNTPHVLLFSSVLFHSLLFHTLLFLPLFVSLSPSHAALLLLWNGRAPLPQRLLSLGCVNIHHVVA